MSQVAHEAGAYRGFRDMKRLGGDASSPALHSPVPISILE